MSGNMEDLDLNVEEESKEVRDFSLVPNGDYEVVVTASELKENKSGQGKHVGVTMQIITPEEHENRMLWHNFNVVNYNPTAEKIGRSELAALCKAVGVMNPKDTTELHDIPLVVRVGVDRKDPTRNVVKAFLPKGRPEETPVTPLPKSAPKAEAKSVAAPKPWQKKK